MDTIFLHVPDCLTLLNKRAITKEILIKYLHKNKVSLTTDFTKTQLVNKIIDFWYEMFASCEYTTDKSADTKYITNHSDHNRTIPNDEILTGPQESSEFPINLLARKFSEWFFDKYNKNALKVIDFWSDASLLLQISANDGIDEKIFEDSNSLLQSLVETQQRFDFYFNPNLSHAGVQGRMDVHGLVLVLACGTLHTKQDCVGVFECVFGLLRDPFAENNWKCKKIKLMLRSKGAPAMPSLEESSELKEALKLPEPQGDLT